MEGVEVGIRYSFVLGDMNVLVEFRALAWVANSGKTIPAAGIPKARAARARFLLVVPMVVTRKARTWNSKKGVDTLGRTGH